MNAERFGERLFAAHLVHGKIHMWPNRDFSCILLVQDVDDVSFIKWQALNLVMAGCSSFYTYGEKASLWADALLEADHLVHPFRSTEKHREFVLCFEDFEALMTQVQLVLDCRPLVPHDVFLLYDHIHLYESFLKHRGIYHRTMILDDLGDSLRRLHFMKEDPPV